MAEDDIILDGAEPREGIAGKKENDAIFIEKDGFGTPLKRFPELIFALACAGAFGAILHFFPENIFVFANASLFVLFIVLLVLVSRILGIGKLLSGMLKAVPSVKRLK